MLISVHSQINILENEPGDLVTRLEWSLKGRLKYPFGSAIGLSRGTINRLFSDRFNASSDLLNAIRKYENISIDWLLNGWGEPYVVRHLVADSLGPMLLDAMIDGEPLDWSAYVFSDTDRTALVLRQPSQYYISDRAVEYTQFEVLAGELGPQTYKVLENCQFARRYIVKTNALTLQRLAIGMLGTFDLIGEGWLDTNAEQISSFLGSSHINVGGESYSAADRNLFNKIMGLNERDRGIIASMADSMDNAPNS